MAHKSFTYKGHDIYLANTQLSKIARGGTMRSLQIIRNSIIVKQIRFKRSDPYAFSVASKKATEWIDNQIKTNL